MRRTVVWSVGFISMLTVALAAAWWFTRAPVASEAQLRRALNVAPNLEIRYRNLRCQNVGFEEFARGLRGWRAFQSRTFDPAGKSVTLTVARKGEKRCPFPYPRVADMPALDGSDLTGARVTSEDLRGRHTVMAFFFATCPTCRRDVAPLNALAARHPELNTLAVTYEPPDVARAFAADHDFRWRIVPEEAPFIRQAGVYVYPTVILFAPDGRVLARLTGGVKGAHDARSLEEGLERWLTQALAQG
jgi:peroxiredoxin